MATLKPMGGYSSYRPKQNTPGIVQHRKGLYGQHIAHQRARTRQEELQGHRPDSRLMADQFQNASPQDQVNAWRAQATTALMNNGPKSWYQSAPSGFLGADFGEGSSNQFATLRQHLTDPGDLALMEAQESSFRDWKKSFAKTRAYRGLRPYESEGDFVGDALGTVGFNDAIEGQVRDYLKENLPENLRREASERRDLEVARERIRDVGATSRRNLEEFRTEQGLEETFDIMPVTNRETGDFEGYELVPKVRSPQEEQALALELADSQRQHEADRLSAIEREDPDRYQYQRNRQGEPELLNKEEEAKLSAGLKVSGELDLNESFAKIFLTETVSGGAEIPIPDSERRQALINYVEDNETMTKRGIGEDHVKKLSERTQQIIDTDPAFLTEIESLVAEKDFDQIVVVLATGEASIVPRSSEKVYLNYGAVVYK